MSELAGLVDQAVQAVDARLAQSPDFQLFKMIKAQLEQIRSDVAAGGKPAPETQRRINLGLLAARELESTDPEFADLLMRVEYQYKRL